MLAGFFFFGTSPMLHEAQRGQKEISAGAFSFSFSV